jgi:hypothetical protein
MGVNVSYNSGGTIDTIGEIKKIHFPEAMFPDADTARMKGFRLDVPAGLTSPPPVECSFSTDIYLVDIGVACSGYYDGDYWEMTLVDPNGGEEKMCETMYTKELPENIAIGNSLNLAQKVLAGTKLRFSFFNISGTSKKVWPTIRYLYKKEG